MLSEAVGKVENWLFSHRTSVLAALILLTIGMGYFAKGLRMDAGFEKQIPYGHEYVTTFMKYRSDLYGANRLTVVIRAKKGSIWTREGLKRVYEVTQAVSFLPYVDKLGVQSIWTPNSFVNQITEDGFRSEPLVPGTVTPDLLSDADIRNIERSTVEGNFIGSLVSRNQTSAMVTADLGELNANGEKIDYVDFNHLLEQRLRKPFEDTGYEIQIIGFAKQIGEIADGAKSVLAFCCLSIFLTALSVYWYCRSIRFTVLALACSMTSLVWQFGTLRLLGFGLDPLGVLVPFLVFAIGVSHGVQQISFITRELAHGETTFNAARRSFSGLLIPGTLALVTAFVSFVTLLLIPIPMIHELAITASIGVAYKIVTNLIMLPLAASCFSFSKKYSANAMARNEKRKHWLRHLTRVGDRRNAALVIMVTIAVFAAAAWESRDRVVGTLQPGAPELRPNARFNQDAVSISNAFDVGLDWLTVVVEAPPESCESPEVGTFDDALEYALQRVPGIVSITSYPGMLRTYNEGYNEGNPKMNVVPIDKGNYAGLSTEIARNRGYLSKDCSMTAINLYLSDHKATTINTVISAVKQFRITHNVDGLAIKLAAGNAGIVAAVNDEVSRSELPMMLYVFGAIIVLVFSVYRDVRAVVSCCLPLAVGTYVGYWFMKAFDIGLTVATLPVMVLAVGIGVDYAFYVYNRLQGHLANGQTIAQAVEHAILEVGMATIFTAITLAIGVATWSLSALKFQADMGMLLAFMFVVNLVMAMTALPALAVLLDWAFPRTTAARVPRVLGH